MKKVGGGKTERRKGKVRSERRWSRLFEVCFAIKSSVSSGEKESCPPLDAVIRSEASSTPYPVRTPLCSCVFANCKTVPIVSLKRFPVSLLLTLVVVSRRDANS